MGLVRKTMVPILSSMTAATLAVYEHSTTQRMRGNDVDPSIQHSPEQRPPGARY